MNKDAITSRKPLDCILIRLYPFFFSSKDRYIDNTQEEQVNRTNIFIYFPCSRNIEVGFKSLVD